MSAVIIGTAGHIDHGKTALVKALTGMDTDRLEQEKQRGITIELGFAPLELPGGQRAAIVDVPGHERLVKTMVAGTSGIDLVMLVVAADEGVMPQTREHLDICRLMGVKKGLVALNKIDMVDDEEWLELVEQQLEQELAGSFLEGAPVVRVSAKTGHGVDELLGQLARLAGANARSTVKAPPYLAVDRVFAAKGFGAVVTGTLVSGSIEVGQQLDVVPDPDGRLRRLKARNIEVHGEPVQRVDAPSRTAINLAGTEHTKLHRGQVVVSSGTLEPTTQLEASIELVPGVKP
ncbi:MAG: selenocysteine-specific translation elongation factor, partial [Deltaproteobacteria bacterium]